MKTFILYSMIPILLFSSCEKSTAQRHYPEISAVETSAGNNFTGEFNPFWNLEYSRYIHNLSYYKVGFNYMKTTCDENSTGYGWKSTQWFLSGNYYRTLYGNRSNLFFSLGGGAFVGSEKWFASSKLMTGGMIGFESEYFLSNRYALTLSGREYFSVLTDVRPFNTVFSLGCKYLFY